MAQKIWDWLATNVFKDEPLRAPKARHNADLPPLLEKARKLEENPNWELKRPIFLKQARMLENYEDNFEYKSDPVRYYPTYQSLTDEELRAYFTFRTKIRKGIYENASLSFIHLYIYELLNNIGVQSPSQGYAKLLEIRKNFGDLDPDIINSLDNWLHDYVIYYNLDPALLSNGGQDIIDQCVKVLEDINTETVDKVMDAVKQIAPNWLKRSKFYGEHYEDMDMVIFRVIKKMSNHYAKSCKKTFAEQYFGEVFSRHVHLFNNAVFCDPLNRTNYEYKIAGQCVYKCHYGIWTVYSRTLARRPKRKFDQLFKTIDGLMREMYDYGKPVQIELSTQWIIKLIKNEVRELLEEKAAKNKLKLAIDFSQLDKIRNDASQTRDKLIVEEEADEAVKVAVGNDGREDIPAGETGKELLTPVEYRLMDCLLHNKDINWLKDEGHLLSVLVDSINGKFYDKFEDTVLEEALQDGAPRVVEDYIEDLKEIITA